MEVGHIGESEHLQYLYIVTINYLKNKSEMFDS